jgi:hypothetical protein
MATQKESPIVDINKPNIPRALYQEFPKTLYNHKSGHVVTVKDEKEEAARKKQGFKKEPSPNHDYSQINASRAAKKSSDPEEENLPALEVEDEEEGQGQEAGS